MTHPLDGPRFKIRRAIREIKALGGREDAWRHQAEYEIIKAEFDPKIGEDIHRLRVYVHPPLDMEWGVTIGEIAHNLRSALNNLAWQLAFLNTTPNAPSLTTQFPICSEEGRTPGTNSAKDSGSGFLGQRRAMIGQLCGKHQNIIEGLQPYQPGRGGKDDPLLHLSEINNADKHRLIQVVAGSAALVNVRQWAKYGAHPPSLRVEPFVLFEDGARVFTATPSEMNVQADFFPCVTFREGCPEVERRHVFGILYGCANKARQIIDEFAADFP